MKIKLHINKTVKRKYPEENNENENEMDEIIQNLKDIFTKDNQELPEIVIEDVDDTENQNLHKQIEILKKSIEQKNKLIKELSPN